MMHKQLTTSKINGKKILFITALILGVLSIPLIAMQFTNQVDWSPFDFIAMAVLLGGTAFLINLTLKKVKSLKNRLIICGAVLILAALFYVELAVGILGTPFAGS